MRSPVAERGSNWEKISTSWKRGTSFSIPMRVMRVLGRVRHMRPLVSNANGGSQGASTLTQQYVRNVLIEAGLQKDDSSAIAAATERSTARKLREIKYALTLEKKFSKEQILEGYLNIAALRPPSRTRG